MVARYITASVRIRCSKIRDLLSKVTSALRKGEKAFSINDPTRLARMRFEQMRCLLRWWSMQRWISTVHNSALASRSMPVALRYVMTAVLVALTVWAQMTWSSEAADRYPFLIFIPAIFVAGALLDRGNGFFATVLSAIACAYYFLDPRYSLSVANSGDQAALALFVLIGFAISAVVEALHVGLVELAVERETAHAALKDRDLLLNELSHRTRNDFANVVTLLNLQSRSANDEAKEALASAA